MAVHLIRTSVLELVSYVLRSGDLPGRGFVSAARLREGTLAHQRLQRQRPAGYQAEVPVSHTVQADGLSLVVSGRVDGLLVCDGRVLVEEIKSVEGERDPEGEGSPVHWAQAMVYACIVALQGELERVDVQLSYVRLEPWQIWEHRRTAELADLQAFFDELVQEYLRWARLYHQWCLERDASIARMTFPFPELRRGQTEMMEAVRATLSGPGRLFVQAPTGIGKTVCVLYPAIQALGQGQTEKVFYLTAKTVGRTVAEKAVDDLRSAGLRLKSLTLTARDRICFGPRGEGACNPETCEYAVGYFDRINGALEEVFAHDALTRALLESMASRHRVCPFELSLELSLWADLIICDYNYVLDPRAYLRRLFPDLSGRYVFLVDEAHNLVDRAREMFSAEVRRAPVMAAAGAVRGQQRRLASRLDRVAEKLAELGERCQPMGDHDCWVDAARPDDLLPLLEPCLPELEQVLGRGPAVSWWDELLDLYFEVFAFLRVAELYDEHYLTYAVRTEGDLRLRLFCVDPARNLREALLRGTAAVFFSATLTPLEYFREVLGGDSGDRLLSLDSPFPRRNLCVLVADHVATTFRRRGQTQDLVAQAIAATVSARPGNYLAYFPSYRYMEEVLRQFRQAHPGVRTLVQTPGMSERQKEGFLSVFDADNEETVLGFAVMGGIFGEGIDLVGERLVGAVVVGVGLPQICLEREVIRQFFAARESPGFAYAYAYPGMNRVLQAAGRVIRSPEDRGVVLLVDQRFGQEQYQRLFPPYWRPVQRARTPEGIAACLQAFWSGAREVHYDYEPFESP
ncbi:MAG: ATP-dependent DNA helicase [Candidatus Latescibacterota bacterium]